MHKLWASTYKELLLLLRDIGGLAILFLMPLFLVITITLVQNDTFKTLKETKITILLVDNDQGEVSKNIQENLKKSTLFEVLPHSSEAAAKDLVQTGEYQLAIVVPANLSKDLHLKVAENVENILEKFGEEEDNIPLVKSKLEPKEIKKLYFDPATQFAFRNSIKSGIGQMVSKIETQSIYKAFKEQLLSDPSENFFDTEPFLLFKEIVPSREEKAIIPNATQHNIPAWTLFAIFFIILPLSINMVKEKNQGTFVRLRTQPVSYATFLGGKTVVFLGVALVQFALMLLVGVYLFPLIGLPPTRCFGQTSPALFRSFLRWPGRRRPRPIDRHYCKNPGTVRAFRCHLRSHSGRIGRSLGTRICHAEIYANAIAYLSDELGS